MLDLAPKCLAFWLWYAMPINILSHSDILSQDWKFLKDVIIDCMEDSLYWMTSDVLEFPCTISPFYIAGGVCVIPSEMFSTFRFLIILPVANMMCRDMVLRKPIPLMCMRSQQIMTSLYLSRMVLRTLVFLTGSTYF